MLSAARYDVAGIAERERLSFWQETVGSLFPPADIGLIGDRPFSGSISRRDLGTLAIADIRSVAQHVSRRPRHIDRNVEDVFEINFQLAGTGFVAQGGREAETAPGQFVMYDSARPYEMRFDGAFRQLTVKFPRSKLTDRLWVADRLTAVNFTWRDGPGRLVFDFMRTLGQLGLGGDPETVPRLQEHALDLLATTLRDADATRREAGSSHTRLATLRRAQTFIRDNLGDPDLSPRVVAEAAHIAIRTLYELFAIESSTPGRWIQTMRLDACRRDLEDPLQASRAIGDIAFARGFSDAAHFSRLFRSRYGLSPRAWCAAYRRR